MIVLRDLRPQDSSMVHEWRNRPSVSRFMYTDHRIERDEHDRWFAAIRESPSVKYWIIERDDTPVGVANLANIDRRQKRCSWAFYLADAEATPGVGTPTEYGVLTHVFDTMGFDKLCCEVLDFNARVVSLHEKFGFKQEGRLRQHVRKGAGRVDVIVLGLLKAEWEVFRESPLARRLVGGVTVAAS